VVNLNELVSPCVSIAALCRSFRRDADGSMTIEGNYDAITLSSGDYTSGDYITLAVVVLVHGGHLLGEHVVDIVMKDPRGRPASDVITATAEFTSVEEGAYVSIDSFRIYCREVGVYWFEVYLGGRLMLRRPLRIVRQA
jgi:Family of unknown function (DUF6941)